jgi:RHS repeat-associated protein
MTQSVSSSQSLSKHISYYDTGTPLTVTDVNGAQTTYNYGAGSCGFSFPDSITLPLSLSTSTTYNCTGGVATSSTDANGNQSFVNYTSDPFFWRPNSSQDAAGVLTTVTYSGATQVESILSFNAGNSAVDILLTTDSLGRPLFTQKKESPSSTNYDSVQQIYDVVDALSKTTMPYVGTAGQAATPGGPTLTTNYDPLGRPLLVSDAGGGTLTLTYTKNDVKQERGPAPAGENTKAKQLEYDALGRLTSVCEITGGTGSGACGQTNGGTGFLTTYSYSVVSGSPTVTVTQNAQGASNRQTRVYTYDLLGRLISEQNPESGSSTYTYDTADATCGSYSSPGGMVEKHDTAGNVTCTQFDAFHRQTLMTYPSGPNASVTPARFFQYDNPYLGSTGANIKGRLVAAGTCQSPTSCAGNSVTLLEFGYSPRGEVTDTWESTPHSGGMYHIQASYHPNGKLKTLGSFLASGASFIPTETYSVDGEGRWQSVSASASPNPVLNTNYNAASQITAIEFGSTDTDAFQYDSAGRMNTYTFTVNGSSEVGVPTWNGNGTLASLAITDPFNASDAQTCNYGYDDLARLTSANCGTAWSQTFSYDVFGNLTKSGSVNWQPGYNQLNNRYALAGTTYDANGNLTNDTFRAYVWDANGKPTSMGSKTMTYDAFGRMVEKLDGGVFNQFVYSPMGGLLARMDGQAAGSVRVPLPGAWASYSATNVFHHYEHLDWLGNSRLSSSQSRAITSDVAYAPFGEPYASTATSGVSFTGMRGDIVGAQGNTTNGVYDFQAREYPYTQGRWLSPDPAGLAAVNFANPQTWNRYTYVANNPLFAVDPTGRFMLTCAVLEECGPPEDGGSGGGVGDITIILDPCYYGGCLVDTGHPGGGGGGGSAVCDAHCRLQEAEREALNAAVNNSSCAQAVDGGTGMAASNLQANLSQADSSGDLQLQDYNSISTGNISSPGIGGTTTSPNVEITGVNSSGTQVFVGVTSTTTMNSNSLGLFMNPNFVSTWLTGGRGATGYTDWAFRAIEILHESGHAAARAGAPSAIVDDDPSVPQTSELNTQTIENACYPQGDFGNQGPGSTPTDVPAVAKPPRHPF